MRLCFDCNDMEGETREQVGCVDVAVFSWGERKQGRPPGERSKVVGGAKPEMTVWPSREKA